MLIINTAFEEFDPKEHVWSIVWFSDFQKSPEVIYRLFGAFARKIHGGEDIFTWADLLSKKTKYSRLSKYLEIKPGVFGVSVDVKSALDDLAGIEM